MMGMGPVHLVRALFHFALKILLVLSVAEDPQKCFPAQNLEFLSQFHNHFLNIQSLFALVFLNLSAVAYSISCPGWESVGANCWPSDSGCGYSDRSNFIRCVDGREPEVDEVWILGEDGVDPKVHPTAQVDVDVGVV